MSMHFKNGTLLEYDSDGYPTSGGERYNGEVYILCERCGAFELATEEYQSESWDIVWDVWRRIFSGRQRYKYFDYDSDSKFCKKCLVDLIPIIHKFRDIAELETSINKLKGAINEKSRNQNNRAVKTNACNRCTRCTCRHPRH